METVKKNLGGRPPLPPEEKRSQYYIFRVAEWEKKSIDNVGDTTFWRAFVVACAEILGKSYKHNVKDYSLELVVEVAKKVVKIYEKEE